MTSMSSEAVATIVCTCKQTRFDIGSPNYRDLDIEGLNITVTSKAGPAAKGKTKKSRGEGTEILNNAKLRLKASQRYALVGRNGTGKSTLLRAIAEKLIPGIPEETRVAILQQTNAGDVDANETQALAESDTSGGLSVLEEVIERATARSEVQKEIDVLSKGIESPDAYGALRSLRDVRHIRLQKELFLKDKDARLRSGARGMQARKALIAMEKEVAAYKSIYEQKDDEIEAGALAKETSEAADMLAELELQIEPSKIAEIESRAKKTLTGLGFSDERMQQTVASLSGGWKMRTALAATLLQDTDILILDEPTNYLDLLGIMWLQQHLVAQAESPDAPTLILVSHDRDFISLCTDLLIIRDKDLTYFHGDLPMYESSKAERKIYMTKMRDAKEKQKEHIQQSIQKSMKDGKAKDDQNRIRQAKSRQKKLDDRWGLEVSAKGGRFKLNRDLPGYHLTARADIEVEQDERPVHIYLPEPPDLRFPGALISLEKVSFRYPAASSSKSGGSRIKSTPNSNPMVLKDITLSVGMGDRIGIVGLNGCGKSTLIKLLVEDTRPAAGTLATHPRLRLGYYSQQAVEALQRLGTAEPELTALSLMMREASSSSSSSSSSDTAEMAAGGEDSGGGGEGALRGLLGQLGLPGRLASDVPVRRLSGGQLVRLQLARLLRRRPHCLVLDEATTHLDYETVAALRAALRGWDGAVVLVSHDRWFVRGVVEGELDEGEEDSDDASGSDEAGGRGGGGDAGMGAVGAARRRIVYRLKAGSLTRLQGGVSDFEEVMEKRVRKLMG